MTDLETMRAMLTRAKIEFTEKDIDEARRQRQERGKWVYFVEKPKRIQIEIEDGYDGFVSQISFDLEGNLLTIEAYE